jgi:F-type H+-transporting ATPase subunit b
MTFFDQLGITGTKFAAQVVVFSTVLFILKTYAFGPILALLDQRKKRIEDGEAQLKKIADDLANAEAKAKALIDEANKDATRLIKDAGESAKNLAEQKQQEAIASATAIMAKAREAAQLEHDQVMTQLKREFGRMVADATSRVAGKVLNDDDQKRINQEASAQVSH